jgi:hypothetical protein
MAAYIEAFTESSLVLYAMLRNAAGQAWNTNSSTWEAWNAANWAEYAITLTEDTQSGFYKALIPPAISAQRLTLLIYRQVGGSPASSDEKYGNSTGIYDGSNWEVGWQTTARTLTSMVGVAGVDVQSINGVAASAQKLAISANTIVTGIAVAGTLTVSQMTTNLNFTIAKLLFGRAIYFTSGNLVGRAAAIADYVVAGGKITFFAPLPQAPQANDTFMII